MIRHLLAAFALAALLPHATRGAPLALPPAPALSLTERVGAALPMDLPLVDADGRAVRLGDYFGAGRAVLLVPGYYACGQLCGVLMHSLLQALHDARLPGEHVRVVRFSIDPEDTPADARVRRAVDMAYARFLRGAATPGMAVEIDLLTGTPQATAALSRDLGFSYARSADEGAARDRRYAHPAAVVVATPQGRVSAYLMGVTFESDELRLAVTAAAQGGNASLSDRIALLCAHYDPQLGRHSTAVMNATRALGVLMVAALAAWSWRGRRSRPGEPR